MQLILFLVGLFAIGCALYGLSAGVQAVQRGLAWFAGVGDGDGVPSPVNPVPVTPPEVLTIPVKVSTLKVPQLQCVIDELRELFALRQQGALTQEEFEAMKRSLLAANPETPA